MMTLPLSLLAAHFVGDFVLQSDQMALNKSKDPGWLILHALVYSACFLPWGWRFALVTFWLHVFTDAWTSKVTSRLWFMRMIPLQRNPMLWYVKEPSTRHWFFVAIGADQLLHFIMLALTWRFIR